MKAVRIATFVAALALFALQLASARNAGMSWLDALVVVVVTFAALAAVAAAFVLVARRRQQRRLSVLTAQRPGWTGVRAITALPADTPAHAPRQPRQACALVFGPGGVELWTGKNAPYQRAFAVSWAALSVAGAPVSYVPGRAVVKAGLQLVPAGGPTLYLAVFPGRSLRRKFPAPTAADSVVAALHAAERGFNVASCRSTSDRA